MPRSGPDTEMGKVLLGDSIGSHSKTVHNPLAASLNSAKTQVMTSHMATAIDAAILDLNSMGFEPEIAAKSGIGIEIEIEIEGWELERDRERCGR
jgi:hypothetical protein